MTVSGCTIARADRQSGQRRESQTQKTRSRARSLGRLTDCLKTATCCRSARFSKAAAARPMIIALTNRKVDWTMPMVCRSSRTRQIGNPTGALVVGQPTERQHPPGTGQPVQCTLARSDGEPAHWRDPPRAGKPNECRSAHVVGQHDWLGTPGFACCSGNGGSRTVRHRS